MSTCKWDGGRTEVRRLQTLSGKEDGGFGLDDEEGVGWRVAGGVELAEGVFEGFGESGEDDFRDRSFDSRCSLRTTTLVG